MSVQLGTVTLANPIMTASGTCGYALELADFVDFSKIGGFITKSITLEPRTGNKPQRTCETASGMLNAIGLANIGLDNFIEHKMPVVGRLSMPVFVNVAGRTLDEYVAVAERIVELEGIAGLELNISCPNVKEGGITFGTDPSVTSQLVNAVRKKCPGTLLIVKLTPNVTDVTQIARAAIDGGADVLSLINTCIGTAIDIETRKPVLHNVTGGLSGPAIKPIALNLVRRVYSEVAKAAGVPVIGMGGISSASDALEFIIAGATAVSVGTNMMINPQCVAEIVAGIESYLIKHKIDSIKDLTGSLIV